MNKWKKNLLGNRVKRIGIYGISEIIRVDEMTNDIWNRCGQEEYRYLMGYFMDFPNESLLRPPLYVEL